MSKYSRFRSFVEGYFEGLGFTASQYHDVDCPEPLFPCQGVWDDTYSWEDVFNVISPPDRKELLSDCVGFWRSARDLIPDNMESRAGVDFHLTRNGHGSGFWDDDRYPNPRELTQFAEKWGSCELTGRLDVDDRPEDCFLVH